jgi:hypothetical protein
MQEYAILSANILKLCVYITRYVDCLLARSGSNWFICDDGGVFIDWSRGKLRILMR